MLTSQTGRIEMPLSLAGDLMKAAERLPLYDNKEFYVPALQQFVFESVRDACPDGFDSLITSIKECLARSPYWVVVHGLRFDEGNRLFVAINRAFGELVARPYEKPRAQLVHYIQPATDIPASGDGRESERLHTDTADWETPVELISMVCVRADPDGGGRSRVLDLETAREEVENHLGPDMLKRLEEPVPWQLAVYCGGGVTWRPVLTQTRICWRRYTIDHALNSEGASLSEEMLHALDAFGGVINTTKRTAEFLMSEGDLLISDNTRTIHSRTPISDCAASDRLMIRSWIRAS
ncbi:MAG TPA: TauD/TfdA family dioxygenase [Pyrinomonadaceae bacterium]|nr:TauD/TfdA family dioxygenase [Pyrinomonadaceae bacterium]